MVLDEVRKERASIKPPLEPEGASRMQSPPKVPEKDARANTSLDRPINSSSATVHVPQLGEPPDACEQSISKSYEAATSDTSKPAPKACPSSPGIPSALRVGHRTPYVSKFKSPIGLGKSPWAGAPSSAAGTPYSQRPFTHLPIKSPRVAEVLREADTARFEARYNLKVAELRKANERIRRLTEEAAAASELKEALAKKEEEMSALSKELNEVREKEEENQKKHVALEDKLASLASEHAAAIESSAEKERLVLKEQQAASNQRIKEQSLSLLTMTDIVTMTRRGLALAQMMKRTYSVDSGCPADVSSLKQSLFQRSAAASIGGTGTSAPKGEVEKEAGKPSEATDEAHKEELVEEASLLSIASSSDVLESATIHSSHLFESEARFVSSSYEKKAVHPESKEGGEKMPEGGFELELPLSGELSFADDECDLSGGQARSGESLVAPVTDPKGKGESISRSTTNGTACVSGEAGGLNQRQQEGREERSSSEAEAKDEGGERRRYPAEGGGSALLTISQWGGQSPQELTPVKKRLRKGREGRSDDRGFRSALASIQNLTPLSLASTRRVSDRKYAPSPDIENQTGGTGKPPGTRNSTPLAKALGSQRLPSPQYSPTSPSTDALQTSGEGSLPGSPSPTLPSALSMRRQSEGGGASPRAAETSSPPLGSPRISQAVSKPVDSPSRFQESKLPPDSPFRTSSAAAVPASPPVARRLLIDTPPKAKQSPEATTLDSILNEAVGRDSESDPAPASPFMGWPMPALAAAPEPPEEAAIAHESHGIGTAEKPLVSEATPKPLSRSATSAQTSGAHALQFFSTKEPATPAALLPHSDSLGGSPFFADLTTPVRSSPPSERLLTFTGGAREKGNGFAWDLMKPDMKPPELPGLVIPVQPILDYSGPPTRKRAAFGAEAPKAFGQEFNGVSDAALEGALREDLGKGFEEVLEGTFERGYGFGAAKEVVRKGLDEGLDWVPEIVHGFEAPMGGSKNDPYGVGQSEGYVVKERATEKEMDGVTKSPRQGLVQQRTAAFELGVLTSSEVGPVRKARRQGRLSRELGRTSGTPSGSAEMQAAKSSSAKKKGQVRNVTLKDITNRGSNASSAHLTPKTPKHVEFAPVSTPSFAAQTTPPEDDFRPISPPSRAPTGTCAVLIVLEEAKSKDSGPHTRKTENPIIGCLDVSKTTTLAELRGRIQLELGSKGPERFVFLQAGIGATWHPFSGEVESLVTALTLPVADGHYQQSAGATAETSIPVDSPIPSPTRHAVRLAMLRPIPVKRALYPLGSADGQNGTSGTGKGVVDKRKEKTKGGLSSGVGQNGEASFFTRTRSAGLNNTATLPGPWSTRPAPTLARVSAGGLSVRLTGGLREAAIADVARRERRLRAKDK